jgi:sialidase-1
MTTGADLLAVALLLSGVAAFPPGQPAAAAARSADARVNALPRVRGAISMKLAQAKQAKLLPPPLESSGATAAVDFTPVFTAGEQDESGFAINSFRIPGFVVANTTLVVAVEARLYSYADLSPHHLVVKRSSDQGRSWGPLQTVVAPSLFPDGTTGVHGDVYFDPTPVYDSARATTHLIFAYQKSMYVNWTSCTRGDNATGPSSLGEYLNCAEKDPANPKGMQLFSVSSTDCGATWSKPRNLSFASDATSSRWCGMSGAGGGNGIQLQSGRLVVPGYHGGCECRGGKGVLGPACLQSHVLLADTYSAEGPDWRLWPWGVKSF